MFKPEILLGIIIVLFGISKTDAQIDTSLFIKELTINAASIRNENLGGKTEVLYTGEKDGNLDLTNLLSNKGSIYIKTYGSNSLGTSSIRGGSAGHSLILWNGVPLQSPTLGLLDLSLIPVQHSEKISIQKGGNSALWGSGAIGGVINLENKISEQDYVQANVQVGSYGQFSANAALAYSSNGYSGRTKISHSIAENNFTYKVANNTPTVEQTNAAFITTNINQDLYFNINNKQSIELHYWWQQSSKEIPRTTTQNFSEAFQDDQANRFIVNWSRIANKHKTTLKLAVLDEEQEYVDPMINLISNNNFTQWFAEAGHGIYLKNKHQLLFGITAIETFAQANGFPKRISESKLGFWISQKINLGRLKMQASLREEIVDGELIPITPSIGAEMKLTEKLTATTKVSRNYRIPTLNDRFWMPGGNPDLLPESGWSEELAMQYNHEVNNHIFNLGLTGFNRNIKNWILWSPASEFNFWSAQNLTEVRSRGIETSASYKYQTKKLWFEIQVNYNFIRSTNQVPIALPKLDRGQQLIYTPAHQIGSNFSLGYKGVTFGYRHFYTGENQGINESIPDYHLGNLQLNYELKNKKAPINIYLNFQNIWNAQYVVIERRPMPGTNFQLGLNFKLNKIK